MFFWMCFQNLFQSLLLLVIQLWLRGSIESVPFSRPIQLLLLNWQRVISQILMLYLLWIDCSHVRILLIIELVYSSFRFQMSMFQNGKGEIIFLRVSLSFVLNLERWFLRVALINYPVINEFLEVFSCSLHGIPLDRKIDFFFELSL